MNPDLQDPVKRERRRREVDQFMAMFELMEPDEQERILRKIDEITAERENNN